MSSSNAPPLAKGARVAGRYRIDGLIAQGGMGAVYRAFDESSGVAVALKRRSGGDGRVVRMFEREYHTLVSLKHPRIIEVYDYGVDGAGAYYTMELLDGSDLRELAPLPYRRACRYLRDVASSLALLHARRLLHRDISPRNVRVTSDDRCKLMDFGVLSSFGVPEVLAGTAPFVPPEALGGAPLDQRADLFALGALAYWVLTGRHAYPASAIDELPQVWRTPPLAPSVSRGASRGAHELEPIPPGLDVLVLALLGTNPLGRPASAAEVIGRLTAIAGLEPDQEPLAAESYLSGGRTVGRAREQARLLQRLETALAGTGTAIAIDADPGLGSSRLLSELAVEAQLRGGTPVVVDAELRRGAYGVVHELIAKLLESAPEEALSAAEPHAAVLSHFSRELRARLPETPAVSQKLAPGELRVRVQKALADWFFAIAAERPLVLAIDNAHRMDDASGAVVATLSYHVREHRLMLATVVKSGEDATAPLVVKSLSLAGRLRPFLGKHLSLYVGLGVAAVRFVLGRGYGGIEGLRAMIVMSFNCVLSLGGVAATCLDAERGRALAGHLEHLTALGKDHAATMSYRFAVLLSQVPTDHLAETIAGYRELLSRLLGTRPTRDLPDDSRLMMIGGINYAIGALESFRDGEAALSAARALDDVGLKLYAMVADQVRANYHACRGEVELADYFRDRVEMHAVQAGSGWQAEVWAPASAILSTMVAEDVVGMKRTSEELERLARDVPSLRLHAAIARAGSLLLRGEAAPARDLFASILASTAPRSFIGWGAISGAHARACIALGDFEAGREICTRALERLSAEDRELTAMYLSLHLELAVAEAHLGEREAAVRRIDALLDQHRESGGPVTLGSLHRTRALIGMLAGDLASARLHLAEMERRFQPTRNPGLLQQCEKLRRQLASSEREACPPQAGDESSEGATAVEHPLRLEGESSSERRESCLASILKRTGGAAGYLFGIRGGELALIVPANGPEPPEHVVDQVRRDVRSFERNRRRASTEVELTQLTQSTPGTMVTRTIARPKEHDYRTVVLSADGERAIGAAAILAGERHVALPESLARSLAKALAEHEDDETALGGRAREKMSSHSG